MRERKFFRYKIINFLPVCLLINFSIFAGVNFSSQSSKVQLNTGASLNVRSAISSWDGTLSKKTGGTIIGSSITFDEGIFSDESGNLELTAAYDPSGARKLSLSGTQTVRANPGTFINKLNVSSIQNWLMGQPLFLNSDSVQLTDANSELTVAVQSDFNSDITMNGGKIKLDNDLKFSDQRSFFGLGLVELRGHKLEFGGKDLTLTNSLYWQSAEDINLNSRVSLSGTWTFGGNSVLNGHGNVLDLTSGGTLCVDSNSTLNLTDVTVKGLGSTNGWFVFKDNTSSIKMSNVTVELDNSFTVSVGGIYIDGPATFVLKNHNFRFDQYGTLTVDGMTLWKEFAAYDSTGNEGDILFGDEYTEKVLINDGTISGFATDLGIKYNSNAILNLEDQVKDNSNAIVTLEDQVEANSNAIMWHDEQIRWNSNAIVNNENLEELTRYNSNAIDYMSDILYTATHNISYNSNSIVFMSDVVETATNNIAYNSSAIVGLEDQVENNSNAIMWHDDQIRWNSNAIVNSDSGLGEYVVGNSNAIIYMDSLGIKNFVSLSDAKLYSVGAISGDTTLYGRSILASPIDLQGGTLDIYGDMLFSSGTTIISSGNLQPHGYAFVLGGDLTIPDGVDLKFTNSGVFDGQGHSLTFEGNSRIRFDNYITVTFRNIKLHKVKGHSDGSASINVMSAWRSQLALENADLYLDRDVSFTQGQMYIHGDVSINGTNQFNYTSTKDAFITSNASFLLDNGTTFSYGPSTSDDRTLIKMTNITSMLYLNGATLKSTTTGLILSKGTLIVDHKNYLVNSDTKNGAATSMSQAISFGDETNDLNVEIMPGGNIELMSGILDVN